MNARLPIDPKILSQSCWTDQQQLQKQVQASMEYVSIEEWSPLQESLQDQLVLALISIGEHLGKVQSLIPEVTRLTKLIRMNWQFWQAARQGQTQAIRRQAVLVYLEQLGHLLAAIVTLLSEAELSKTELSEGELSKAELSKTELSKTELSKTELSKTELSEAN